MVDSTDITKRLAENQRKLLELPDDAFAEKYDLLKERDTLREEAAGLSAAMDSGRTDEELLRELAALRSQVNQIEKQRIDLVMQAGSGGAGTSEMGNLGGVKINKGIEDAHGLPKIKARLGVIKGHLIDRGVEIPKV
ncbi:MAG: hypothetical protein ABFR95_07640 [Actinomycetota bacterium]